MSRLFYFLVFRYDEYRSEGGTKSYGNFLVATLNTIVFDMPEQEFKGADFLKSSRKFKSKSNRYRRGVMDRANADKAKANADKAEHKAAVDARMQVMKVTEASVEELGMQVLFHSLFS